MVKSFSCCDICKVVGWTEVVVVIGNIGYGWVYRKKTQKDTWNTYKNNDKKIKMDVKREMRMNIERKIKGK